MSVMFLPEDLILRDERLQELLSERAIYGLDADQQAELDRLLQGRVERDPSFDTTAALVHVACMSTQDMVAMPDRLRERLERSGDAWCAQHGGAAALNAAPASAAPQLTLRREEAESRAGSPWRLRAPWLVAAAASIVAVLGWLPGRSASVSDGGRSATVAASPSAAREALLRASPADLVQVAWGDWDKPEVAGVKGEVVWSDAAQAGYMTFDNLPALDASRERYQLWIIDSRGMEQRISGGVFNGSSGTLVVPITPAIKVVGAAAFAITIERPEGTWVSDMKRRVVIAAKPS